MESLSADRLLSNTIGERNYSTYIIEENRKMVCVGAYASTHTIFRDFLSRPE